MNLILIFNTIFGACNIILFCIACILYTKYFLKRRKEVKAKHTKVVIEQNNFQQQKILDMNRQLDQLRYGSYSSLGQRKINFLPKVIKNKND